MANESEEILGPRKTMFVLVIVVGCFAVLWPRILSPLIVGPSQEQLKPNKFDRDAGCCEVIFEREMAILQLMNEVCSSFTHTDKLSPYSAAECRKAVNETCGVDIVAFLKRTENVGKSSKQLVETMKNSNSSCLQEHFGVPVWSLGPHIIQNSWTQLDTLKQERPAMRGMGPHPALRERGRAIPAEVPSPPVSRPVTMPPHARVRSSPLSVYYELDIKPPPIPGMRPPLGSPGGPVPAPKSSMGFVMPIYTICIVVFFMYTICKILFKRTATTPYEPLSPDPQFRRRVFRDGSRTSPDKLVVSAISGLVAEVQQQMEASYAQNQQRQDVQQDNHTRPYTNGTILHNSGPVHIVASEYQEQPKEKTPEPQTDKEASPKRETAPEAEEAITAASETIAVDEEIPELEIADSKTEESNEPTSEILTKAVVEEESEQNIEEISPKPDTNVEETTFESESDGPISELQKDTKEPTLELEKDVKEAPQPVTTEPAITDLDEEEIEEEIEEEEEELEPSKAKLSNVEQELSEDNHLEELTQTVSDGKVEKNGDINRTDEFLREEASALIDENKQKQSTPELIEEAIRDEDGDEPSRDEDDNEKSSVKHEAESVQSIFLETDIPQQSRVLVADFAEDRADKPQPTKHSPMVVSGKMTLSLIQDAPRDTPERDPESTLDEFTTASAVTQDAAEKEDGESEEEIEEEIEIEEIEEEVEEIEEEEEAVEEPEPKKGPGKKT